MKRIIKNIILSSSLAVLLFSGCSKDYLNVNDDPNRVTDENVTPELVFTQAEEAVGGRQGSGDFTFLNNWMGYFAPNGDFAPNQVEQTYNIDFTFADPLWQRHYNVLFDLYQSKMKAISSGGDTVLAGAAMVLSAKLFQDLVDLFGDVPYKQAFQSLAYPNPEYDDAQEIYNSLLLSLDTAIDYLNHPAPSSFAKADIIAGGNQGLWVKFANTIRLRLLIRQSQVGGFDPSATIGKIMSSGGVLEEGENISVNPGYLNDVNKQSPFYSNYGYDPTGNRASTSENANDYIINTLVSAADPRLYRFFQTVNGNFVGNPYGELPGNINNGANSSYFGPGLIGDDPGSGEGASQGQWIMPGFESLFLKAEAVARGWMTGDAKAAYEAAVTESFVWLGVPNASTEAANYLSSESNLSNFDSAGSTTQSKVNFIVFQKYIALCGVDPLESYCDERRLHFLPDGYISVNPARVANTLPLRLLYPQSEYTTNGSSVQKEGDIDPYTSKIFWEP